jgi:signal transduction histidine kinase
MWIDKTGRSPEESLEVLARLTARLASTARLDEIVETVLKEIVELGFGAVWMAALDEASGNLLTLKEVIDGVDTTHEMPRIFMLDMRQPIGHGFRERRMINIRDPEALYILEHDADEAPQGRLALPRVIYEHMRKHPFACGPLLGSGGQPVGALGLSSYRGCEPIPDEVFSEGLLRAFMAHLGIAMERAQNITRLERINAELVAAQTAIARDARIEAVGELAAAVAHDLNNLAGVAVMSANVGMRSPVQALDALPRIERATRAIGDLVSRLQRVAREAGGETDSASVNLRETVEDIVAMTAPLMRERSVTVELALDPVPPVRCERSLAHQLVLNLLLNANDALGETPRERRRIRIQLRDDQGVIRLIVSDSGPGIDPKILPHLFEPFVTSKPSGHAGLGLAASRASIAHFGGRIEGRNNPSGGAVFEVALEVAPDQPAAVPASAEHPPDLTNRHVRILAIDDDPDIVDIIHAYLEPLGYDVVTTTGADEGMSAATAQVFDVVICDVGMPGRSGLEVCQLLRRAGFGGKLILMTGWDTRAVEADRRVDTCDMLLKKPFVGNELRHAIESLLAS